MTLIRVAAAIGFIATAWYLLELFFFASRFRRDDKDLWIDFGQPERFGISGQWIFLSLALGIKRLPSDALARYQHRFIRIRLLLAILLVAFLTLAILTSV